MIETEQKILDDIIDDLKDRSGLGDTWYQIDNEIQMEIKNKWKEIIKNYL